MLPQNDPLSLRQSAVSLQELAHLVARLAKHADHLPCAMAETADVHNVYTNLQALSDDVAQTSSALKTQCCACLESLATVQGLSCSDDLMDEILHRIFSTSTDMSDVGAPMLSPMTSSDALSTSQLLDGIVTASSATCSQAVNEQLDLLLQDSMLCSLPLQSSPCNIDATEGGEHTLLRQLSLDGSADPQTSARLRRASSRASSRVASAGTLHR